MEISQWAGQSRDGPSACWEVALGVGLHNVDMCSRGRDTQLEDRCHHEFSNPMVLSDAHSVVNSRFLLNKIHSMKSETVEKGIKNTMSEELRFFNFYFHIVKWIFFLQKQTLKVSSRFYKQGL